VLLFLGLGVLQRWLQRCCSSEDQKRAPGCCWQHIFRSD